MRKLGIFACRLVSKHCQLKYLESTSTCQQNVMKICTVKINEGASSAVSYFSEKSRHKQINFIAIQKNPIKIILTINKTTLKAAMLLKDRTSMGLR